MKWTINSNVAFVIAVIMFALTSLVFVWFEEYHGYGQIKKSDVLCATATMDETEKE